MANSVEEFGSRMKKWGKNILIGGLLIWAGIEIGSEMIEQVYGEHPDLIESFGENIETTRDGIDTIVPLAEMPTEELIASSDLIGSVSEMVGDVVNDDFIPLTSAA